VTTFPPQQAAQGGSLIEPIVSQVVLNRLATPTAHRPPTASDRSPARRLVSGAIMAEVRFSSPFKIETPPGAEGWKKVYDLRAADRQEQDNGRFWFAGRLHHPEVVHPYAEIQCECWTQGSILSGRRCVTPVAAPSENIAERAADFTPLPEMEPIGTVPEHVGQMMGYRLIREFDRLALAMFETYQHQFELLNFGYAAYVNFFQLRNTAFPGIGDQSVARMVGGLRVDRYGPEDELRWPANEAERSGIAGAVLSDATAAELVGRLARDEAVNARVADWNETADPWTSVNTHPDEPEDMFLLRRSEVAESIYDCVVGWSVGCRSRGAHRWWPIIAERRGLRSAAGLAAAARESAARRDQLAVHRHVVGDHQDRPAAPGRRTHRRRHDSLLIFSCIHSESVERRTDGLLDQATVLLARRSTA